jgi:Zn finger protein HypA/HybF involved in hydrogenase expression
MAGLSQLNPGRIHQALTSYQLSHTFAEIESMLRKAGFGGLRSPARVCFFEDVPIVVYCGECQAERPVRSLQSFVCNQCGAPASQVVRGRELEVAVLDLAA